MLTVVNSIKNNHGDAWWGFVRRSSALSCVLPSFDQASENQLTKEFKGPFVILRTHSRV